MSLQPFKLPNLIEIQLNSYKWFIEKGLRELFDEVSPIRDWGGKDIELHFLDYRLDEAKYDEKSAKTHNLSYEAPALNLNTRQSKKQLYTIVLILCTLCHLIDTHLPVDPFFHRKLLFCTGRIYYRYYLSL